MTPDERRCAVAPHINAIVRREQRRGAGYYAHYPLLVWVRRYPEYYARLGWREKAGSNCIERTP